MLKHHKIINTKGSFYAILQVSPKASQSEIRASYYQLCMHWHPDVNQEPQAKEVFLCISQAFQTLSDEKLRAEYDCALKEKSCKFSLNSTKTTSGTNNPVNIWNLSNSKSSTARQPQIIIHSYPFGDRSGKWEQEARERLQTQKTTFKFILTEIILIPSTIGFALVFWMYLGKH